LVKIAIGMQADLAFFNLEDLRFSGAGDPIAVLVQCGAYKVKKLMIAGQWVIKDGQHGHMDPMQKH
jgi:8-oxoguanine deaminase